MGRRADDEKLSNLISEDGYFVVSKKTIRWGVGILSMVLMALWGSVQYSVQQANEKTDKSNETLVEVREEMKNLVKALEKEEIEPLEKKVQKMEITDAILLERTNSKHTSTNSDGTIPNNTNNQPPSELPTSSGPGGPN